MLAKAVRDEFLFAAGRVMQGAARIHGADHGLERKARFQKVGDRIMQADVFGIGHHQPVFGIEQREAFPQVVAEPLYRFEVEIGYRRRAARRDGQARRVQRPDDARFFVSVDLTVRCGLLGSHACSRSRPSCRGNLPLPA